MALIDVRFGLVLISSDFIGCTLCGANGYAISGPLRGAVWADREKSTRMSPEVFEILNASWRKSLRSVHNGACVEVASAPAVIAVRDSVDRSGPHVQYTARAWRSFIDAAKQSDLKVLR